MQIIGVSFANTSTLRNWADDQGFQYELWDDTNKDLAVYYGAGSPGSWFPDRITVLLDGEGNQLLTYNGGASRSHAQDVLEDAQAIFGE